MDFFNLQKNEIKFHMKDNFKMDYFMDLENYFIKMEIHIKETLKIDGNIVK